MGEALELIDGRLQPEHTLCDTQPCLETVQVKWFRHEIVRPGVHALEIILPAFRGCQHDNDVYCIRTSARIILHSSGPSTTGIIQSVITICGLPVL